MKIPTTSRVGRGNENNKEASSIKVPSINISVTKKIKVIEEPVPVEDNCLYDFPIEIPIQCNSPKSVGDGTDDVVVTEVVHCNGALKETRKLCISKAELAALKKIKC